MSAAVPAPVEVHGPRVKLLTTGGTISTAYDPRLSRTRPALSGAELLGSLGNLDGIAGVDIEELFRVPSWALGPAEMFLVAQAARDAAASGTYAGVVVTHGTTTLEFSAFMADLYLDVEAPVVFTGSMREADVADTDGPRNLRDAIRVAASAEARGKGALVCMNGDVLAARDATKLHRTAVQTFVGLEGPLGHVDRDLVAFYREPLRRRVFHRPIEPAVALVKAYPGAGRQQVDAVVGAGVRGIVVEGLPGAGGVPPAMQEGLRDARARGVTLVLASRSPLGRVLPYAAGGTGAPLRELDLLFAGTLTAEKAWVLLMAALGETGDPAELRAIFLALAP